MGIKIKLLLDVVIFINEIQYQHENLDDDMIYQQNWHWGGSRDLNTVSLKTPYNDKIIFF